MKKIIFTLAFALLNCLTAFSQATSLTVDNQTPGWLSSKINYNDQKTLQNLKVTGYINADDLTFIGQMMSKQSLKGCIDLEDANIVGASTSSDNVMPENAFQIEWNSDYPSGIHISHIKLPLSITKSTKCLSSFIKVDTISIGSESMPSIIGKDIYKSTYSVGDGIAINRRIKHIIFREGVTEIADEAFHNNHSHTYAVSKDNCIFETVTFPSTLKRIGKNAFRYCYALKNIVFPNSVETIDEYAFDNTSFMPDTLDLPLNLKTFCTNSFTTKTGQIIDLKENVEVFDNVNWSIKKSTNLTFVIHRITPPVFRKGVSESNYSLSYSDGKELSGCTIYVPKEGYSMYSDPTYDSVGGDAHHWNGWANPYSYANVLTIYIEVESIQLNTNELKLAVGNTSNLIATVYPSNADNTALYWTTSDPNVANVDSDGRVSAVASGTATITVKSVDNPTVLSNCKVTVNQPVQNIEINPKELILNVDEQYNNLELIIYPKTADNKSVIWSSDNPTVCSVDNGKITALSVGKATIFAKSVENENIYATCKVTINQPVTGINLDYTEYTLNSIGSTIQLGVDVTPEDASNKDVNWKSSNEGICIVSKGTIVAVGYGTCVIIATTVDGGYMATCTIKVEDATGISTIYNTSNDSYRVYTPDGKVSSLNTKGIKIIKFSNGIIQKICVK